MPSHGIRSVPQQVHVNNFRVFEEALQGESVELHKLDIMHIAQAQAQSRFHKFYVYVTIDFDAKRVRCTCCIVSHFNIISITIAINNSYRFVSELEGGSGVGGQLCTWYTRCCLINSCSGMEMRR